MLHKWGAVCLLMVRHVLDGSLACVVWVRIGIYTGLKLLLVHGFHGNGLYNIYSTFERDVLLTYPLALEISPNICPSSVLRTYITYRMVVRHTIYIAEALHSFMYDVVETHLTQQMTD